MKFVKIKIDNVSRFLIIPFILVSVALIILFSESLVEKLTIFLFIVLIPFIFYKKIPKNLFFISFFIFSYFLVLGIIYYLKYPELGHILLPIVFLISFYLGFFFPYKNNFIYIFFAIIISFYISYLYISNFNIVVNTYRFEAPGFDINYLGFISNYLFIITAFYIKENKNNILMYVFLIIILIVGFLTSSRGTILAFIFGISLLLYEEKFLIKICFFILILIVIAIYIHDNYVMVKAIIDRFTNPSHRDEILKTALEFYLNRDLFDQLLGIQGDVFRNYGTHHVTHNDEVRILLNYGFIGLISYLLMYFFIIRDIFMYSKNRKINKKYRIYAYFVLMMIFMYLFRGNFSNFFPMVFIYYFIGSFYGIKHRVKRYKYAYN
jgi:hypothetical protein